MSVREGMRAKRSDMQRAKKAQKRKKIKEGSSIELHKSQRGNEGRGNWRERGDNCQIKKRAQKEQLVREV